MASNSKEVSSLSDLTLNDDWDFGNPSEDKTNTSTVVKQVKGATIDDVDEDDDDNEKPTNLENKNTEVGDEDEDEEGVETLSKKAPKKTEPTKEQTKKKVKKEADNEDEDVDNEDEDVDEPDFSGFEDEAGKGKQKREVVVNKDKADKITKKDESQEVEESEDFYTALATEHKEKGIFEHVEIPKDKKLTEDEYLELWDEETEARVIEELEAFTEGLDDEAKAFIKHKKRGGSTRDFVETYYGSGIDYDKFDADNEEERDALIRYYVQTVENVEPEDVEERLQTLKDNGTAKVKAEKWAGKLKAIEDKKKEDFEAAEQARIEKKKEDNKKFNESLIGTLNKVDKIGAFNITKTDQRELASYLTKPTVKVGKDRYIPAFQDDLAKILRAATKEDKEKLVLLSKLVKNGFDVTELIPKVETKITRKANNILQRAKTGLIRTNTGVTGKRVLADAFEDDDE